MQSVAWDHGRPGTSTLPGLRSRHHSDETKKMTRSSMIFWLSSRRYRRAPSSVISGASGPNFTRELTCSNARATTRRRDHSRGAGQHRLAELDETIHVLLCAGRVDLRRVRIDARHDHVHLRRQGITGHVVVMNPPRINMRASNSNSCWFLLRRHYDSLLGSG